MVYKDHTSKKPLSNRVYKLVVIVIASVLILQYLYQNSSLFYQNTLTLPFSLHLSQNDLYLKKGEEYHLYVNAINQRVSYYSTNIRVAGVNFNGRVFGYQTGKAFIIARVDDRDLKCRVHVIDINRDNLYLKTGETYHLKIRGSNAFVSWHSKNKAVASVSLFGKVTAKGSGTTIVYGKIKGKTLKCKIIVK